MGEVKLIGTPKSRFTCRVQWALKLKDIEYEFITEDLKNKSPTLLKHNPVHKKVPVLVHDGKPICESLVILEYIDDVWNKNPLLPEDPFERAVSRFWAKFSDEKIVSGAWEACKAQGDEKEKAVKSVQESLRFLEKEIEGNKFFDGERIGYLDLVVGWVSHWLKAMEEAAEMKLIEEEKFPSLYKWCQSFLDVPVINECVPPRDLLLDHFRGQIVSFRSSFEAKKP